MPPDYLKNYSVPNDISESHQVQQNCCKESEENLMKQRPRVIDKKMRLPITVKEGEEKVNSAKYADGVLTIEIPITKKGKEISLD